MRGHITSLVDIKLKNEVVAVIQRNQKTGLYIWHTTKGFRSMKPSSTALERWRSRYYEDSELAFQNCFDWISRYMRIKPNDLEADKHIIPLKKQLDVRHKLRSINPEAYKAAKKQIAKVKDILSSTA